MSEVLKLKIRKDLSRWSRKLLLCIGLETIGRQLVGEESWQTLYPVQGDWEPDRTTVSDFDPTQVPEQELTNPDPSYNDLDPSATPDEDTGEEKNDFIENFFHLLPYWYFINRAFGVPGVVPGDVTQDLSNNTHSLLEAFDAQRLNSFLVLHSLKQQQLQVQAGSSHDQESPLFPGHVPTLPYLPLDPHELANIFSNQNHLQANVARVQSHISPFKFPGLSSNFLSQDEFDEPLDLTQKNKNIEKQSEGRSYSSEGDEVEEFNSNGRDLRICPSPDKTILKSTQRSSRGYTTQELEAALKDIQSGKLGTRRAAVIYGIPRSTLRNKVYKLGKDRGRSCYGLSTEIPSLESTAFSSLALLSNDSGRQGSDTFPKGQEADAGLRLDFTLRRPSSMPSSQSQLDGGFRSSFQGEETEEEEETKMEDISHEKKVLKEWLRSKLSRQKLAESTSTLGRDPRSFNNSSDCSEDGNSDAESRQDAAPKGPGFAQTKSAVRRKLKLRSQKTDSPALDISRGYMVSTPGSSNTSPVDGVSGWKRSRNQDSDGESEADLGNGTEDQVLKSRPKRGKYRNYDRDALLKAVKAVQNGEMSVHRAGSFFGVPHSTLEYKVKERHLLRRPKKKGGGSPKSSQKSSPESSLSGSEPLRSVPIVPAPESASLAPSTRESLSCLLNIGTLHTPLAGESGSAKRRKMPVPDSSAFGDKYGSIEGSPYMNLLHIDQLIRHNLDNSSLLDLTKRS